MRMTKAMKKTINDEAKKATEVEVQKFKLQWKQLANMLQKNKPDQETQGE